MVAFSELAQNERSLNQVSLACNLLICNDSAKWVQLTKRKKEHAKSCNALIYIGGDPLQPQDGQRAAENSQAFDYTHCRLPPTYVLSVP
jgi:hypothetical protein